MKREGTLFMTCYTNEGQRIITYSRSSFDLDKDGLLVEQALMFRDAARRDGRLFVCALVPRWKRVFLKLLKIKVENV